MSPKAIMEAWDKRLQEYKKEICEKADETHRDDVMTKGASLLFEFIQIVHRHPFPIEAKNAFNNVFIHQIFRLLNESVRVAE